MFAPMELRSTKITEEEPETPKDDKMYLNAFATDDAYSYRLQISAGC